MLKAIDGLRKIIDHSEQDHSASERSYEETEILEIQIGAHPELRAIRQEFLNSIPLTKRDMLAERKRRAFFTPEESEFLEELVEKKCSFGEIRLLFNEKFNTNLKTTEISERWCRVQDPEIRKGKWSKEEDNRLCYLLNIYNGDLHKLVSEMGGRTLFQIQERMKRIFPSDER